MIFVILFWSIFLGSTARQKGKQHFAIITRFPGSLETSLREPAFASIAWGSTSSPTTATAPPPFQSGLGLVMLKKAKTKISLCDTIVDVIDKAKIKDTPR